MEGKNNKEEALLPFSWIDTCEHFSQKDLFTYKEDNVIQVLTGIELATRVRVLGSILQEKMSSQEKAIIILPQGMEYIYSMLSCFYANVVAIPISITSTEKKEKTLEKISHILEDSQASLLISDTNLINYLQLNQIYNSISIINVEEMNQSSVIMRDQRSYEPDNMAILLYTSGSTSQPKGVMLSHSNILSQALQGAAQWGIIESSRIVTWMPQFHSFGLYLNILSPLIKGASSVILSPSQFVADPKIWFETINEYQATHTGAPNFAFDVCYSSIEIDSAKNLALNSLEAIICGGEPIRKETYLLFTEKFRSLGLRKNVFCPHYGMSEVGSIITKNSSQAICFKSLDLPSLQQRKIKYTNKKNKSKSVVSCGEIQEDTKIRIVNPDSCVLCSSDEIGEIWVKSSSVGLGYLNAAEDIKNSFFGVLSSDGEGGFFRTGDLGFIKDNQLYVVGRQKEVIIVHGKKHYAVDIEWTIKNNIPALTLPISVFSYETDDKEKVVVIQETENLESEDRYKEICREIVTIVSENHGLELDEIYFVNRGKIPRTGSGKILRNACRNLYLNKGFEFVYQYIYEHSASSILEEVSHGYNQNDICSILTNEVFLHFLPVSEDRLNTVTLFSEFGLNSIQYIRISKRIEDIFHIKFAPVNLFKYQNIEQLANYISSELKELQLLPLINGSKGENSVINRSESNDKDIAIIGMSCNLPGGADNPETFWKNIMQNKDCITPIEQSRKQVLTDYENTYKDLNKEFPQFGGFIQDIEAFDAHFFNISPLEAECMDPQQRKVLELTWNVIESSGYNPRSFEGKNVGLFMGVHSNDYSDLIARQPELMDIYGAYLDSGVHMSLITHRVSRWFNFHGPSEIINTACSSSLVAIHHAIESIYSKESSVAIAGGINLIAAARVYLGSYKAGMLSEDGKCKTFDQDANGFVRSEGYGAVLLKPYSKALNDKDNILGIIKASAINHDGHSNSLRAPNFNAQKELLKTIYSRPDMEPNKINYIEAHGTGTPIGDPIEVQALQEAFQEVDPNLRNATCGLGSVKTNIGHCESASGVASLIKVLLSMKHETLPGILHFNKLNPYIKMENSPFYIVEKEKKWERIKNADGSESPRRAGISSFGFGGANAHIIVEENTSKNLGTVQYKYGNSNGKYIIPISARDENCLNESVRKLYMFFLNLCEENCDRKEMEDNILSKIAFTLQEGREAMETRVVFLVSSIKELIEKMDLFLNDNIQIKDCWKGNINENEDLTAFLGDVKDPQKTIETWLEEEQLDKIAQFWAKGGSIDWKLQYVEQPMRMYLPTYPFAKTYYWIPESDTSQNNNSETSPVTAIHPLLQKNTSNFIKQQFSSIFTGQEPFISDHIVKGQPVMPAAALIEMACAAIQESFDVTIGERVGIQFKNVVWTMPIIIDRKPVKADIALNIEENKEISFEICSTKEKEEEVIVHSQGNALLSSINETQTIDITPLLSECNKSMIDSEECYRTFQSMGITYGSTQQGIKELYIGVGKVLTKLMLPIECLNTSDKYTLHPAILDSAFQSTIGLTSFAADLSGTKSSDTFIPFAIEKIEVYHKYTTNMWAVTRYSKENQASESIEKFDIDLCDENGNICARMKGLSLRAMKKESGAEVSQEEIGTVAFYVDWKEKTIDKTSSFYHYKKHFVYLCECDGILQEDIETGLDGAECIVLKTEKDRMDKRFHDYFIPLFEKVQTLMKETSNDDVLIQIVFPNEKQQIFAGLAGLLRTAQLENPKIFGQVIGIDALENVENIVQKLKENSKHTKDIQIKYLDGKRLVSYLTESSSQKKEQLIFKNKGIYLITGGMGGIGFIFAKEIIDKAKDVTLILTGRSKLDDDKQNKMKELMTNGANIVYLSVDVSDEQAVCNLMTKIKDKYGDINGIIHSAGQIKDNFIIKKSIDEVVQVLAPKVSGIVNLDYESKDMDIDFFVSFSSIAGVIGNIGQADYSAGNAFMDAFAEYRNTLVNLKQRKGKTVSINWPLWKDGGMHVDEVTKSILKETMGMLPMNSSVGIAAFYQVLMSGYTQELIVYGKPQQIKSAILAPSIEDNTKSNTKSNKESNKECNRESNVEETSFNKNESKVIVPIEEYSFKEKTKEYLKTLLSSVIRLPANQINADEPMEKYGIDSVMVVQLTNKLEKTFGPLSKTLFFEYKNLSALAGFFTEAYRGKLVDLLGFDTPQPIKSTVLHQSIERNIEDTASNKTEITQADEYSFKEKTKEYLKILLSSVIRLPANQINADEPMEKCGIDSVMVVQLTNKLEKTFGPLSKTLFFEYKNLSALAGFFAESHKEKLVKLLNIETKPIEMATKSVELATNLVELVGRNIGSKEKSIKVKASSIDDILFHSPKTKRTVKKENLDIAIIGIAGRYPGANNIDEFWKVLREGLDCVTEIPKDRWDHSKYYDPDKNKNGKTNSKWGGFIDDVDKFDPLFFNISPLEAELMDPQERLFLQCSYESLEDAGYTRELFENYYNVESDEKVGVFAGVMYDEYQLYGAQETMKGRPMAFAECSASIANRVSYYFNLNGPSMTLNTMCSSSLTAIHLACQSIQCGECSLAFAGGANVSIHPNKYLMLGKGKFLSNKGRCETFGQGGDGYVPSEGVGVVLLKPLSEAIKDKDNIYGVIKGSTINHDGKTNSFTVPNPIAQGKVILKALEKAEVDPRTVSYIEAHGTGTSLGDPIEITGLTKAFEKYTHNMQFCSIGSVKSNIGHCESASGIAGLTKILLQLKYKQLVPSLHSKQLNPNIDFIKSPFVVQQELTSWDRPIVKIDGESKEYPRRAGISSFGAGGSNAHIIIEEYIPEKSNEFEVNTSNDKPVIFVLSAKTEVQLMELVKKLLRSIWDNQFNDNLLRDMAYTLQVGREAMNERLALIVHSIDELEKRLKGILNNEYGINTYRGQTKHNKDTFNIFSNDEDLKDVIDTWISKEKYEKLLEFWVRGLNIDWNKLYTKNRPNRISLPTYPFAKERYWAVDSEDVSDINKPENIERRAKHFLQKQWEPSVATSSNEIIGTVAILVTEETFELGEKVAQYFPMSEILDLSNLSLPFDSEDTWKNYGGFIDLIGCNKRKNEAIDWITWLQKLIEHGLKERVMLLCVTKSLESFKSNALNLSGSSHVGIYRMLQSEYRHIRSRHMDVDQLDNANEIAYQIYSEFISDSDDVEICYRNKKRYRAFLEEIKEKNSSLYNTNFPEGHVLWITGGTRGLGYLCAQYFIEHYGVKYLVITGQEELPPKEQWDSYKDQNTALAEKIRNIQALESQGVQVYARAVSLVDKKEMEQCLAEVKENMGPIGGMIHCAGIMDNKNPAFIRKNLDGMKKVLSPKVDGLELLCQCFQNEPLRFMLLFSSVSAIIPSLGVGQSDYVMANAFMDYFAQAHSSAMPIVSIQWPNWKQAGMGEIKSASYKNTGLQSITNTEGLQLLSEILSMKMGPVVLPAIADDEFWKPHQLMQRTLYESGQKNITIKNNTTVAANNKDTLFDLVTDWLINLFAKELKLDLSIIEVDTPFQDYGLESILLTQVLYQVNQVLEDELSPSTFYEYPTIQSLAEQLIKTHGTHLYNHLFQSSSEQYSQPVEEEAILTPIDRKEEAIFTPSIIKGEIKHNDDLEKTKQSTDIAVVGLSCRFPEANSLDEYWKLLSEGRSAIKKVPYERWGIQKDYYAGLLQDISHFDPQFFHIHEEDARQMDPQALMLLEESLKLWYQAGYNHKEIKGKAVGVYIGARNNRHEKIDIEQTHNPALVLGQNYLASNISNYFDLCGPSLVVDTACSSSLVAMNMAIQALQCGEIEAAMVGGINLLLDDEAHKVFQKRGILNPGGAFHIFDSRANGIVLGEGAGMVLLKTVDRAILDGDRIYSIIKGIAVNNDGRTAGPATPNIQRQKEVMETALRKSGKNASEIQYIEANGSGSEVTDLLELKSMESVYGVTGKSLYGIGSMKPNIGHPLCAEGIASFIKTVLMINKKQFVPFLSGEQAMKHFDINASRFYFNKQLTEWKDRTRIAAINSFGDGGTNCHVILESYKETDPEKSKRKPIVAPKLNLQKMEQVNYFLKEIQEQSSEENLAKKRKMIWQLFE